MTLDTEWQQFRPAVHGAERTVAGHGRLVFALGTGAGTVDLAGVSLRPGTARGPADRGVARQRHHPARAAPLRGPGGPGLGRVPDRHRAPLRGDDARLHQEGSRRARERDLLADAATAAWAGLARERASDFTDMHAYWQHPQFPRRDWDPGDWRIRNTAMTRDTDGGTLAAPGPLPPGRACRTRSASTTTRPRTTTRPSACRCWPRSPRAQDWDGIYLFDYNSDGNWNSGRIRGFFSIDSNPAKMALLPAAAMLFLRGDVAPAAEECDVACPRTASASCWPTAPATSAPLVQHPRGPAQEYLTRRLSLAFVPGKGPVTVKRPRMTRPPGPVRWHGGTKDRALFTADSPRSKVMVGFLGGRKAALPGWQVEWRRPTRPSRR